MEVNDYYKILGLGYKFNELKLLRNYFKKAKITLSAGNKDEFIKARIAYEVIRDEKAIQEYGRLYRKYVLNEDLNFPALREQQMVDTLQAKEKEGAKLAIEAIKNNESYTAHLYYFIVDFILADLLHIISWGISGIALIAIGILILVRFDNQANVIGGILSILAGVFFLRRNIIWKISGYS